MRVRVVPILSAFKRVQARPSPFKSLIDDSEREVVGQMPPPPPPAPSSVKRPRKVSSTIKISPSHIFHKVPRPGHSKKPVQTTLPLISTTVHKAVLLESTGDEVATYGKGLCHCSLDSYRLFSALSTVEIMILLSFSSMRRIGLTFTDILSCLDRNIVTIFMVRHGLEKLQLYDSRVKSII